MVATHVQDRNGKLGEYLELLHSMAQELDRSMGAIAQDSLSTLEDSIANQQAFAARLRELADDLIQPAPHPRAGVLQNDDEALIQQIRGAADTLQSLNRRYAALIQLSSRSVGLMVSLFNSFKGQIQEGSGARPKQQTWSCQA
jgi:hypothetical protein